MFNGQCHCGNVKIYIQKLTETATSCNCSLCNRYGSVWGYFTKKEVDTKRNNNNKECIEIKQNDDYRLIILESISKMEACRENPHFKIIKFD